MTSLSLPKNVNFWLSGLLVCLIGLFLFSLPGRVAHIDDAWLGEHAYFQAKLGYVKSNFMEGLTLQEFRVLCHHKFLTLQGALVIHLFGFKLMNLKIISLIYFLFFIFLSYQFLKNKLSKPYISLFYILIFSNPLIIEYSFVFRPEILLMTYGFIIFITLNHIEKSNRYIALISIGGGFISGIAFSTHLNGIIFLFAGVTTLFIIKKYRQILPFVIGFMGGASIYFYDYTSLKDFNFFVFQVSNSPLVEQIEGNKILFWFGKVFEEHLRFFHSPPEIILSLLFITAFILLKNQFSKDKLIYVYCLSLIFFLAVFSANKTTKYLIIYIPYILIIILNSVELVKNNYNSYSSKNIIKYIYPILFFSYVITGISKLTSIISYKDYDERFTDIYNSTFSTQPNECSIVAPMEFIFYGFDKFKKIQSQLLYTELQKSDKSITGGNFLEKTKEFSIDYLLITDDCIDRLGLRNISPAICKTHGFKKISETKDIMVFKNLNGNCSSK